MIYKFRGQGKSIQKNNIQIFPVGNLPVPYGTLMIYNQGISSLLNV